jgi:hypothetical protein
MKAGQRTLELGSERKVLRFNSQPAAKRRASPQGNDPLPVLIWFAPAGTWDA